MQTPTLRQKIVVLTGAGISKESGLDTFRDKEGLWQKHDAMRLSSIEGFEQEPQAVLDFYNARRKQLLEVEPNEAHKLLAQLEQCAQVCCGPQPRDYPHRLHPHQRQCHPRRDPTGGGNQELVSPNMTNKQKQGTPRLPASVALSYRHPL